MATRRQKLVKIFLDRGVFPEEGVKWTPEDYPDGVEVPVDQARYWIDLGAAHLPIPDLPTDDEEE